MRQQLLSLPSGKRGYVEAEIETQGGTIPETALVVELKKCGNTKDLQGGKHVHSNATETGCQTKRYVANALISMYSKCGSMLDAREVFENMLQRDVVSWTALIDGYVKNGESLVALDMFNKMDCAPDRFTYVAALKACACLSKLDKNACLHKGLPIHRQARERGFEKDIFVASTLVNMYSKCGDMQQARGVFNRMRYRNVVSWTALILGYVENGEGLEALALFNSMDCLPNCVTFVAALKTCASLNKLDKNIYLQKGMNIHIQARELGFDKDVFVASSLVDMYSKHGKMLCAREVFDGMVKRNAVSWNSLMLGYVENGESLLALDVFNSMDCAANHITYVIALKACASLASENKLDKKACLHNGVAIHRQVKERGFEKDLFVASTLVDMYRKCGDMVQARDAFDGMMHRNVVSWTSLIFGYVETGESSMALDVFNSMDCTPDGVTFAAALKACAILGALEAGQRIHDRVCELGLEQDEMVAKCLVDFYGKCGRIAVAEEVFLRMHSQDRVSWTALIGGYSLLGDTYQVLSWVKKMQEAGLPMDGVIMLLTLTAFKHAGMVEEGVSYFQSMSRYGINPTVEHYTCMVDILGRANRLQDALSLVSGMPFETGSCVWMSLLWACRKWNNLEVGNVAFSALLSLNDKRHVGAAYVLMRNIYEKLGMEQERECIEVERKKVHAWEKPGHTWCCDAVGKTIHSYVGKMEQAAVAKLEALLSSDEFADTMYTHT